MGRQEWTPQLTHLTLAEGVVTAAESSCGWEARDEQCSQAVLPHSVCFSVIDNISVNPNFPICCLPKTVIFAF